MGKTTRYKILSIETKISEYRAGGSYFPMPNQWAKKKVIIKNEKTKEEIKREVRENMAMTYAPDVPKGWEVGQKVSCNLAE